MTGNYRGRGGPPPAVCLGILAEGSLIMNVCIDFYDIYSVPFVLTSSFIQLPTGISVCVLRCVGTYMHGRCVCACIWQPEDNLRCLSSGLSTFFFFVGGACFAFDKVSH